MSHTGDTEPLNFFETSKSSELTPETGCFVQLMNMLSFLHMKKDKKVKKHTAGSCPILYGPYTRKVPVLLILMFESKFVVGKCV